MTYLKIAEHYDNCFKKHGDSNLGVDWPNHQDTLTRHQIMLEVIRETPCTLLDFGCGLGHLNEYILTSTLNEKIEYSGLDINEGYYNACQNKFPNLKFYHTDLLIEKNIPKFDYIIINGVFTEKRELSQDEMMDFVKKTLIALWDKCEKGMSFNFMSKQVDWERDDLFHVSLDEIAWFMKDNLSRNFIIRNDYKLFEYTIYVYK